MTWNDIEKLSATNVIVHAWMTLYRAGQVTREQMLCGCIKALAEYAEQQLAAATLFLEMTPTCKLIFDGTTIKPMEEQP